MKESLKKIPLLRKLRSFLPEKYSENYRDYKRFRESIREQNSNPDQQWRDFQYHKLKEMIELAWNNIEGYRELWEKAGFNPAKFKAPEDIMLIPAITKHDIRENPDAFINPHIKSRFLHKSGGSTGTPFQFYEPMNARVIEKAFMHEIWSRFYPGISLKTRSTIIRGKIIKDNISWDPMLGLVLSTFKMNNDIAGEFLSAIEKYKTPLLHAYPAALYFFARMIKKNNWKIKHRFEAIMLGSEKLYEFQRELLLEVFDTKICHWYGQAEQVVLAGKSTGGYSFSH